MYRNFRPGALGVTGTQSEVIELAMSYGFQGLDLDLVEFQKAVKTYGLAHARRFIDSARLKLGAFVLPVTWDDDDTLYKTEMAGAEELLSLAAEVGLRRAVTCVAPANDLRPYHENFEFHRRRLTEIGEALARHGIKLGLQVCSTADLRKDRAYQFIHSFDALAMLVGMIRGSNVGVVPDLFEMHIAGNTMEELVKLGAERIVSVIVSDAPADKAPASCTGADRLLPAETGTIDLGGALSMLSQIGYDGPLTPSASAASLHGMKRDLIVKTAGARLAQALTAAGVSRAPKAVAANRR